jgi:thymidine kinase
MQPPLVFDPISSNENLDETVLELVQPGLTVYAGPMFSGKSRMLINAIDSVGVRFVGVRERLADPASFAISDYIAAFVPSNDTRSGTAAITSRGALETELTYPARALPPTEPWRMLEAQYHDKPFVFIDEGNFWGYFSDQGAFVKRSGLKETVQMLVEQGREVYVGGLSADFRNEPFGEMGDLLAIADQRPELRAWQGKHQNATRTQRIISGRPARYTDPVFLVGDAEAYEPRSAETHRVVDKRANLLRSIKGYLPE